ncbi:MAG: hypothetical protein PHQ27_11355 [Victivallales bacterium]|nr:hypothetical protein [Victivallales bacterium]
MKQSIFWLAGIAVMLSACPMQAKENVETATDVTATTQTKAQKHKGKGVWAELELTREQRKQVQQTMKEIRQEMKKLHQEIQQEMKQKMDGIISTQTEKLQGSLSPEQYQKVTTMIKERMTFRPKSHQKNQKKDSAAGQEGKE